VTNTQRIIAWLDEQPDDANTVTQIARELLRIREQDLAVMARALDALESDSNLKQRQVAFEMLQDRFENSVYTLAAALVPKGEE
jgi:hypothetical protein